MASSWRPRRRACGSFAAAMDAEGLTPEALEQAAATSGARAAYRAALPEPHRPGDEPRSAGARSSNGGRAGGRAADRGRPLRPDRRRRSGLPPLAQLAPADVAYVSGLSKSLGAGAADRLPDPAGRGWSGAGLDALRVAAFGPPSFSAPIGTHWIETGEAFDILDAVRAELAGRTALAGRLLAGLIEPPDVGRDRARLAPVGELDAERIAGAALRAGVRLTAARARRSWKARRSTACASAWALRPIARTLERGLAVSPPCCGPGRSLSENVV